MPQKESTVQGEKLEGGKGKYASERWWPRLGWWIQAGTSFLPLYEFEHKKNRTCWSFSCKVRVKEDQAWCLESKYHVYTGICEKVDHIHWGRIAIELHCRVDRGAWWKLGWQSHGWLGKGLNTYILWDGNPHRFWSRKCSTIRAMH